MAMSKRKGRAKSAKPTATTGERRKITLYFRQALLEEARSSARAFASQKPLQGARRRPPLLGALPSFGTLKRMRRLALPLKPGAFPATGGC